MAFTFKGKQAPSSVRVMSVTRSILPTSDLKMMEVSGQAGSYFIKKKHGVRQIEVELAVIGSTPEDMRAKVRELAGFLDSDKPEPLVLPDEPNLTDYAIVEGDTQLEEILKVGMGTVVFICPKPFSTGEEVIQTVTHNVPFTVNGTAETFPETTIKFSSPATRVKIELGDEFVELVDSFTTDDVVVINHNTGKIMVNGSIAQSILTLDSDVFSLKVGSNIAKISTDGTASVTMKYNEMWK